MDTTPNPSTLPPTAPQEPPSLIPQIPSITAFTSMQSTPQFQQEPEFFFDTARRNKDFLLNAVSFSDDENTKDSNFLLTKQTYESESNKISSYYNNISNAMEEDDTGTMNTYTGTKHEIKDNETRLFPEIIQLTINDMLMLLGLTSEIIEGKTLINAVGHNGNVLDLDNIIYNANKTAIGFVDDVIGNISTPMYVIRIYPDVIEKGIAPKPNEEVFYCGNRASFVNPLDIIHKHKGCDASNAFDEEVSENEMDYSDDEQEIQAKAQRRKNKLNIKKTKQQ